MRGGSGSDHHRHQRLDLGQPFARRHDPIQPHAPGSLLPRQSHPTKGSKSNRYSARGDVEASAAVEIDNPLVVGLVQARAPDISRRVEFGTMRRAKLIDIGAQAWKSPCG